MNVIRSIVVASATLVTLGAATNPTIAARAGQAQLSVTRLADIIGNSQAPLDVDVARSIAELWVNYQLLGTASARGDSLRDSLLFEHAMWMQLANRRVGKLGERLSASWDAMAPGEAEQRYARAELLSARHILIGVNRDAAPTARIEAKRKAEDLRRRLTVANFADQARVSDDAESGERGGDLGLFEKGDMVKPFEEALLALTPGEISSVVETDFGFHIIYRPRFEDIAEILTASLQEKKRRDAEQQFLAGIDSSHAIRLAENAVANARAVAKSPVGYMGNKSVLATYRGGTMTLGEFSEWVAGYPANSQIRPSLVQAPDEMVSTFITSTVRRKLLLRMADSTGVRLTSDEIADARLAFLNDLTQTWAQLKLDPARLADSARAARVPAPRLAAGLVDDFIDRLVKEDGKVVEVSSPLARALQKRFGYSIDDAALPYVVERARIVRATMDSVRAATAPVPGSNPSAVPTPGGLRTPEQLKSRPPGGAP